MCCIWIAVGFEASDAPLHAAAHRGPDAEGIVRVTTPAGPLMLGHKRLSIYDLSSEGAQPMTSADGRYTLIFNGAIYNFRELQDRLASGGVALETRSDTATLLAAWQHWGPDCLPMLNGMFAFAIHDAKAQTLTLARDRFGEKPLHMASWRREGQFCLAAASEIPQLLAANPALRALDHEVAADFINVGATDWGNESFFRSVHRLPPASWLEIPLDGSLQVPDDLPAPTRWWTPPQPDPALARPETAAEALRPLLRDAVNLRLIADVPVGACLSGGLDSSGIVSLGSQHHPEPLTCVTAQFDESAPDGTDLSERRYVDALAGQLAFNRVTVTPSDVDIQDCLDAVVRSQGEPFASSSVCTQWLVFKAAREAGMTAMLDGQGADELFGGYPGMAGYHMADLAMGLRFSNWHQTAVALAAPPSDFTMGSLLRGTYSTSLPEWARRMIGRVKGSWPPRPWPAHAGQPPIQTLDKALPRFNSLIRLMTRSTSLPSLLRYEDRNAMAFGIESRLPYLDTHVSELALKLPGSASIAGGETKRTLRLALQPDLPAAISHRRLKLGFTTPEQRWMQGPFAGLLGTAQTTLQHRFPGLLDVAETAQVFKTASETGQQANLAFRLLSFARWAEAFSVSE